MSLQSLSLELWPQVINFNLLAVLWLLHSTKDLEKSPGEAHLKLPSSVDSAGGDKWSTLEIFGFFSNGRHFHLGPEPQLWRASWQINPRQQLQHSTIIYREIFHGRKFSIQPMRCWILLPVKWNSNAAKLISKDPNSTYFVFHFVNTA